jgi:hypothetical protein
MHTIYAHLERKSQPNLEQIAETYVWNNSMSIHETILPLAHLIQFVWNSSCIYWTMNVGRCNVYKYLTA